MLNVWTAVSSLDRLADDVMGSAFGAATSNRAFPRPSTCVPMRQRSLWFAYRA